MSGQSQCARTRASPNTQIHPTEKYILTIHRSEECSNSPADTNDNEAQCLIAVKRTKGLNICTAAVFLAGELAGTGVLTMPFALSRTEYYGIPLLLFTFFLSTYCGILLGEAWKLAKKLQGANVNIQAEYAFIGETAAGKIGKYSVSILLSINITLICLVYLTLSTEIISSLLSLHIADLPRKEEFRLWLVFCTCAMIPLTWFGTPKDFWGVGLAALGATMIGGLLIMIKLGLISNTIGSNHEKTPIDAVSCFSAFGTFTFAFTGISLFPTIQTDMKSPDKFLPAVLLGAFLELIAYLPVAIYGYAVLGKDVERSILSNLFVYDSKYHANNVLVIIIALLFAAHLLLAIVMYLNPLLQELEILCKIRNEFSWRRVVLRSAVMFFILILAMIFPNFGPMLDLVGGFLKSVLCFIFPIIFYYRLHPSIPKWHKMVLAFTFIASITGCALSTYAALRNIQAYLSKLYGDK